MRNITVIVFASGCKVWQLEVIDRLRAAGHQVGVRHSAMPAPRSAAYDFIIGLESRRFGVLLPSPAAPPAATAAVSPQLVVDLTGVEPRGSVPTLSLRFNGYKAIADAVAASTLSPRPPELTALLDGVPVGEARPMMSEGIWLSRSVDAALARAISLLGQCVNRFFGGRLKPMGRFTEPPPSPGGGVLWRYPFDLAGKLVRRCWRGAFFRPFHWQVGYRLIDGPGVAETNDLTGPSWTVLPDDGQRFYADPFGFAWQGRSFVFVEEFPYATRKGVIAVAELGVDGVLGKPQVVLEAPHHLSYPQVFARDGEIWMLPESSAAHALVLYRAERFPDRWVQHAVLLEGVEISDATLLERDGRFWVLGAGRDGRGSHSDMLVAYSAERLTGPWTPHRDNPILIDRKAARPGGAFVRLGEKVLLPIQDGTLYYGGGLGLSEVVSIDDDAVQLTPPRPITGVPAWSCQGLHTLNRTGRLELIDAVRPLRR